MSFDGCSTFFWERVRLVVYRFCVGGGDSDLQRLVRVRVGCVDTAQKVTIVYVILRDVVVAHALVLLTILVLPIDADDFTSRYGKAVHT